MNHPFRGGRKHKFDILKRKEILAQYQRIKNGELPEMTVQKLCDKEGISKVSLYKWIKETKSK